MSKYFPDQVTPVSHIKDRPRWAKGVQLTPEVLDTLPPEPPRERTMEHMPKRDAKWLRALAAEHTVEMLNIMVEIARDVSNDAKVRLAAAQAVHDRGWGKPQREVVHKGGTTVTHVTDPGALHAKLRRAVATVDEPRQLGPYVDAEATVEPE